MIGHTEHEGVQRVMSHPFKGKLFHKANRQDLVFVRPPGARDWHLSMTTIWYCKVLLLFSFETNTDDGFKTHDCALVSVLWEYEGEELSGDVNNNLELFRCF